MKRYLWFGVVMAAFLYAPTVSQIEHGTVGVIYYTQDKIIVAADSRVIGGTDHLPRDNECKIVALKGKVVMVVTGLSDYVSRGPEDPVHTWRSNEEVHTAFGRIANRGGRITPDAVASEWASAMSQNLRLLYLFQPQTVIDNATSGNGKVATAIFGGFDETGKLVLFAATLGFDPTKGTITPTVFPISCPFSNYCVIGHTEIAEEFVNLTSPRAIREAEDWKPASGYAVSDLDILKAIRLVDLTIALQKGNDVGGAIDAVQLSKDGTMRWFARKDNCPAD